MDSAETSDYEQYHYPTRAQADLHIDNLYCTGVLRGFSPPNVAQARMLEIGCGDGLNLIPMAIDFPGSEFVGVDFSSGPIEQAKKVAGLLRVPNVRFYHADVRELAEDFGEFDYIVAHGFYSWVPEDAREAFWRVARGSLSENGLLFVSFNTLPGWHLKAMLRDFCALHMERFQGEDARLREGWKALELIAGFRNIPHPLATEAAITVDKGINVAIHDELFGGTEPFYFRDVVRLAEGFGFRYVGDAKEHFRGGLHMAPEVDELIDRHSGEDDIRREQYRDFFTVRAFRRSVFARSGHPQSRASAAASMRQFWITTEHRADAAGTNGRRHVHGSQEDLRFDTDDPMVLALFDDLAEAAPSNVHLGNWIDTTLTRHPEWRGEGLRQLEVFLEEVLDAGVFSLYSRAITFPRVVPLRPAVRRLNRWEATRGAGITTRFHKVLPPPEGLAAGVLTLLDGKRSIEEVTEALAIAIRAQKASGDGRATLPCGSLPLLQAKEFESYPGVLNSEATLQGFLRQAVPQICEYLRQAALLLE